MLSHLKHIFKLLNAAKNKHEYETKKICFHGRFSCRKLLMSVKVLYHSPTMLKFEGSGSKWQGKYSKGIVGTLPNFINGVEFSNVLQKGGIQIFSIKRKGLVKKRGYHLFPYYLTN